MKTAALCFVVGLPACSSLDPNIGPWRSDPPRASDAAAGPDADSVACAEIAEGGVCFARDIRPLILRTNDAAKAMGVGRGCVPCHDGNAATHNGTSLSGFDLSTLGELRHGGGSSGTRIIVPGRPDQSEMVKALQGRYGFANRMPKGGPYWEDDSEEMRLLTTWIAEGAKGNANE
jgi:hypothetical protein